ncbi:MAG: branched-chain amino acid aminotransferase [Clostridiaceae bacterium]|nr:branched-chain amino acid aminotransferase [Clostridiaceae bacterium]
MNILVEKSTCQKAKPDEKNLGFGQHFTDHMFVMDYTEGKGWHDPRIVPYGKIALDPSAMVFHYGQAVFEGLKAYRNKKNPDEILLFRPKSNFERLNVSNDRLCIPPIDVDFALSALIELVKLEKDWIPREEGTSLYIRPFIIATDPFLGVRPSYTYKFMIILSPVGAYYPEGLNPVKIYVEDKYVRAVRGGLGYTKASANYAASIKAQMEAKEKHYTQVLWLDGIERKYIEEVGTMNIFFVIGDEIVTPMLNGSILAGITRDSVIQILKHEGYKVSERQISIQEIYEKHQSGELKEAFGTGTAAVISPVGELNWDDNVISISNGKIGRISQKLYDLLTGIQTGKIDDPFGWTIKIK